jgi:acylphosphatase
MAHYNIRVIGKVQGVFYRASAAKRAEALKIKGFVRNESNGDVYIEAEADRETLEEFVKWCYDGPEHAKVEKVMVIDGAEEGFDTFEIRR